MLTLRQRAVLRDMAVFSAILLIAGYIAFEYDVFHNAPGASVRDHIIEIDEALGLVVLFALLVLALWRLIALKRETARRIAAEREARNLALHDALTGLPNRRQFDLALEQAIASPPRSGGCHAVLLLDLNGFKRVNDVFGHAAGDECLIAVAGRFAKTMREGDMVARFGGDEFAVLALHLSGAEEAAGIALRLIERLKEPVAAAGAQHQIGTGIGAALVPQDGHTPEEALRKADIALYRAKADGVSALHFFEEAMDARVRERDALERALRAAVGSDALRPFYQPLVDLKTGEITGFEALARWKHPVHGELGPDRFIPIAEGSGLIGEVTDWLLGRACGDAVSWPGAMTLSFNISPAQLHDRTFGLRVLDILARTGLAASRLEIEITESALVRDMKAAQETLGALRSSGVRIALDDFGTGYSSLYHLRNFKVDKIKIDRSFVEAMAVDRDSEAIVNALVGLAAGLRLTVTAEGVDSDDQRMRLSAQGCDQGQGYLFSKAVPAEEVPALLSQRGPERLRA
ncbi:MAG TPA: EAL domain-containing protein [Rhizomicrobium sp.]|nr:EAL domain-containing protein [Rhizomicrobium sp.]